MIKFVFVKDNYEHIHIYEVNTSKRITVPKQKDIPICGDNNVSYSNDSKIIEIKSVRSFEIKEARVTTCEIRNIGHSICANCVSNLYVRN